MLTVYADETGTHASSNSGKEPAPGVYGFLASSEYWTEFISLWKAMLAKHGAPYFHFRELNPHKRQSPKSTFFGWDNERVDKFIYDMAYVASLGPVPFGGHASFKRLGSMDRAYKLAFKQFFSDFGHAMRWNFPKFKDKVTFLFSGTSNEDWIAIFKKQMQDAKWNDCRIGNYRFVNFRDQEGIPCQAADLFAFRNRQNSETIYEARAYVSLKALDIILGRQVRSPRAPFTKLAAIPNDVWKSLIEEMRLEKNEYDRRGMDYFPFKHCKTLQAMIRN